MASTRKSAAKTIPRGPLAREYRPEDWPSLAVAVRRERAAVASGGTGFNLLIGRIGFASVAVAGVGASGFAVLAILDPH